MQLCINLEMPWVSCDGWVHMWVLWLYSLVVIEERHPPRHTHMIVKRFGCTTIHKALYKCIIHSLWHWRTLTVSEQVVALAARGQFIQLSTAQPLALLPELRVELHCDLNVILDLCRTKHVRNMSHRHTIYSSTQHTHTHTHCRFQYHCIFTDKPPECVI